MDAWELQRFRILEEEYEYLQSELYAEIINIITLMNREHEIFKGILNNLEEVTFNFQDNFARVVFEIYFRGDTDNIVIEIPFYVLENPSFDNINKFRQEYVAELKRKREEELRIFNEKQEAEYLEIRKRNYKKLYDEFNGVSPESL